MYWNQRLKHGSIACRDAKFSIQNVWKSYVKLYMVSNHVDLRKIQASIANKTQEFAFV